MRAIALVVLLAFSAQAQVTGTPVDAPVVDAKPCLTPEQETLLAQRLVRLETENKELKKDTGPAWWLPVLVVAVSLGAGFGIGYGVARATKSP